MGASAEVGEDAIESVKATHPGWQVIASQNPLPVSSPSYFEVKVLCNPDSRGGLAIGLCGHIPQGPEVHSIRLQGCMLYNSNNGLMGDSILDHDLPKGIQLQQGETMGIRHDVVKRTLQWFHNRSYIGSSAFTAQFLENNKVLFPVFALYVPDQMISVDFRAPAPDLPPGA
ncbi:unnamed protein product [Polarella glacialis]|uniref:B30.2/SPRY domain-containing protein n=1 Tax=Polarella glacialis TaxID=89957 RepID=A0A813JA81_POLGL|nr:unnamed protein product [Polarella glacialis]